MSRSIAGDVWRTGLHSLLAAACLCNATDAADRRPFQVRDSVEMSQFAEPGLLSPDQHHLVILSQRGRISEDALEATLWLFDTEAVRRKVNEGHRPAGTPTALVRMSASINGGAGVLGHGTIITRVTWEAGSDSLLFLGCSNGENRQLFRATLADGKLTPLSLPTQDVVDFAVSGSHVVYVAGPDAVAEKAWWANDPAAPDVVAGSRLSLWETLFPNYRKNGRYMPTEFEVWKSGNSPAPLIEAATGQPMRLLGSYNLGGLALSHDGSRLILVAHADRVPKSWESYEVPAGLDHWHYRATPDEGSIAIGERENDYAWPLQYQLIDLDKGTRRALVSSPAADFQRGLIDQLQASWSSDDSWAALTGTYVPLEPADASSARAALGSKKVCGAAVVRVRDGRTSCLIDPTIPKRGPVSNVSWDTATSALVVRSDRTQAFAYDQKHDAWKQTTSGTRALLPAVELAIRESLNEPPVLTARDPRSGRTEVVFDPNPQLKEVALGDVSVYTWKSLHGLSATGGLAKPPGFVPGHRYPLVIQTHGFPEKRFFRVGYESETANAGRALAGRDMLVLQVREPHSPDDGTWMEASERGTDVYLGAIDQLAAQGLVDPTKVGITGYSRAGMFVAKAITEAPERFAAAAVVNADPGSQFSYYTYIDYDFSGNSRRIADVFAGSVPYDAGLQNWLARAPGFETEKIRAPVLVAAGDPQHLLVLWNLYAPLLDQRKPVELQYIRNGQHNLTKPLEVLAHQQMLVDWFDFWLNGHEDIDSAKDAQYVRWRKLREAMPADSGSH